MFQEFYKDTLVGRFIKRLLRASSLPLLHTIHEESELLEGCYYLYKDFVIKCVTSGKFYVDPADVLYPSDNIYPSIHLFPGKFDNNTLIPGGYQQAQYKVVKYYDEQDKQLHYNYHSKFLYYDPDTHYHLGEYLRYLKDRKDLNLMAYYNCYNNKSITRASIHPHNADDKRSFSNKPDPSSKLLAIPVKFGQKYTVAIDSDTPVELRTLVYNEATGCVIKDRLASELEYYSDDTDDYEFLASSRFDKPFLKYIAPASTADLFAQENNLYLVIKVSKDNDSTVTVLEGDYLNSWQKIISNVAEYKEGYHFYKNISLLQFNCRKSFAFSDRLIEYLLKSVINHTEELDGNIRYVQSLLEKYYKESLFYYKGIWTDEIRLKISACENELVEKNFLRDLDGYLNTDIERLLQENRR